MRNRPTFLYACFFLSGASALIYETVWQRMLTLVLGVSTWSISAVLTAYMAGLTLGAWWFRRIADRARSGVRAYALVEFGIALCSVAATWCVDPLMHVYVRLASGAHAGFFVMHLIRFALSLAVFIVPCTLIGATMPLMGRLLTRYAGSLGVGFGRFYAANTLGAVLGAGLAGFLLIRTIGMHAAVYVACAGNLLAALIALVAGLSGEPAAASASAIPAPAAQPPAVAALNGGDTRRARQLCLLAGLSGLTGLGYEITWMRLLAVYTLNSAYVFAMLLTSFLAALAVGSAIGARWMRRRPDQTATVVAAVQMLLAMTAPLVLSLTHWARHMSLQLQSYSEFQVFRVEYSIVLAVVFVPAVLLGITLPMLAGLLPGGASAPGRSVGALYASNSLGAIVGSTITGLMLIPHLGLRSTLMVYGLVNFGIGCWIAARLGAQRVRGFALIPAGAILLAALGLLAPINARFVRPPADIGDAIPYYAEGETAVVHITYLEAQQRLFRTLYLDSQSVAGDTEELVTDQKMFAHLPALLHPDPRRALIVGFGTGGTSYSMLLHEIETHCVEIERKVPEAANHFFAQNHGVVNLRAGLDPARKDFRLILDDARSWLHLATEPYDLIMDDLTNIQYRGNGNLYTRECFQLIRGNLTSDGIGCAWVPASGLSSESLRMVVRTFQHVYPHTSVWYLSNRVNDFVILTGTPERLTIDLGDWEARMAEPAIREDLAVVDLDDPFRLAASLLLDEDEARCFGGEGPLHTDDKPLLDYLAHAGVYQDTLAGNLRLMLACQRTEGGDVPVSLGGTTPLAVAEEWDRRRKATQYLVEGHALAREGDGHGAYEMYQRASDIVPGDAAYARLAGRDISRKTTP